MRIRLRSVSARALAVVVLGASIVAWHSDARPARAAPLSRFVTGWIPIWSSAAVSEGTQAISGGSAGLFAEVSPFGFSARSATSLVTSGSEANLSASVQALRAQGLKVVPSITDGTGKLVMQAILTDPTTRAQHVQAITGLVVSRGYDGIDLDYEGFAFTDGRESWDETAPVWLQFVKDLSASLRANGKMLAVTIPPQWDNGASGYWVYGMKDVVPHVDRLRLMVYDWSVGKAGPVGPLSWQANVISYVKSVVPADQLGKVQIGVNTYGRSWATVVSGTCPVNASTGTTSVQMESLPKLIADVQASPVRDPSGEIRFTYDVTYTGNRSGPVAAPTLPTPDTFANSTQPIETASLRPALRLNSSGTTTCTVRRTVYAPDPDTIVMRTQAVATAGLGGIAIWALGYEMPDIWPRLAAEVQLP